MRKNKNTEYYNSSKTLRNGSFLRILRCFYTIKDTFSFDVFTFLKAENEKLQIVFANIRV